ncbi:MAG: nucleotidyltransferase domain-containing protein [Chitinophagaceae bacterium]
MNLSGKEIDTIKDFFSGKPVLKAYVFGSYSRNEAVKNSDIDILVELDYSQHIGLGFVQMKIDLEQKLQKPVDLVSSKAISKHILPFVNKDLRLIYER